MTRLVVDCSIMLAALARDEVSPYADAALDEVARTGGLVPALFSSELANGLLMMLRRGRMNQAGLAEACNAVISLQIAIDPAPPLNTLYDLVALAQVHRLTAYDAAYLDLALRQGLPLATLDEDLAAAAGRAGAAIFSP